MEDAGVERPVGMVPAGFWRRGLGLAVDLAVVWLLWRLGRLLALPMARWDLVARAFFGAYALVIPAAYFVLSHGTGGQTLGKRLVGVRVVGAGGQPIGYAEALARLITAGFAAACLGLGLLAVAVRRDKRGWHDRLADTRVVRVR